MKACYVFPGQGSILKPGIGKFLYEKYKLTREIFHTGNEILGYNILSLMFKGPEEKLNKTIHSQPAILLNNLAHFKVLRRKHKCVLNIGHSAGEYSALVASKVLTLEDSIRLVQKRAELMSKNIDQLVGVDEKTGSEIYPMAAIKTGNLDLVSKVCAMCSDIYSNNGIVEVSNINHPSQIVISGNNQAVLKAVNYFKKQKIPAKYLPVEGPFHSQLMKSAEKGMKEFLEDKNLKIEDIKISPPDKEIPYIANFTGKLVDSESTPEQIKELLINQICGTVQWQKSLEIAISKGYRTFIESGIGGIQTKILRKHYRNKGIKVLDVNEFI